jgi:hypothetical protein
MTKMRIVLPLLRLLAPVWLLPLATLAGQYTNLNVAVYIPVSIVRQLGDPVTLSNQWQLIRSQLKVDKVYVEVQRDHTLASDETIESVKKFFLDRGIKVAGAMALSAGSDGGQFRTFCYTDPNDREFVKKAAELAARHFDEVIQDDFFFVTTKYDSDIAAKGNRSWTQFRLDLMNEAAEELLIKPAKGVNPRVKMVIKFPNWYEHFQGLGYDLEKESKLFDGIYAGTETRDAEITDQNLQAYESYLIMRYFENVAPGRNGGGWVDTFSVRYLDRYVEQLWNTAFAKAREITLFNWATLTQEIRPGNRAAWENLPTSFDYRQVIQTYRASRPAGAPSEPTMARVAGQALEQVDQFLGKLGKPIGVASYKPFHSTGEDFLHNYFGMIGIPIELYPTFPTNASLVLLTESAKFDPAIVAKIKGQLTAGKTVVITSGLLRALQGKGIEDIVELEYTDRKILARSYLDGFGAGNGAALGDESAEAILFPDIRFLTNDAWPIIRALAHGRGYPLMLMDRYSKGVLYVWTMPDNFNDLYRLPVPVTTAIKDYVMAGFPVRLDGPSQIALFAYDNDTFIVESYLPTGAEVTVSILGGSGRLRNLVTGEVCLPASVRHQRDDAERRVSFVVQMQPHSYSVFTIEK